MRYKLLVPVTLAVVAFHCYALNPIVQTIYNADPAPVVHDGVCYLYTSYDEDVLVKNFFTMKDWRCFSSTDMVNWTDHGAVASLRDFQWADPKIIGWGGFENGAWAVQCIERGGKWYLYCPLQGRGIGVLVADNPFGPFTDPIGRPLIGGLHDSIDPTVLIDDDGQAFLCWCIHDRDYISACSVDFGDKGAARFLASVASLTNGSAIELRVDGLLGELIGTLNAKSTGALEKWKTESCCVKSAKGVA